MFPCLIQVVSKFSFLHTSDTKLLGACFGMFVHVSHRTLFNVPSRVFVTKGLSMCVRRVSGEVWSGETESLGVIFMSKRFCQRSLNFIKCVSRKELSWGRNRILRGIFFFKWRLFWFHSFT